MGGIPGGILGGHLGGMEDRLPNGTVTTMPTGFTQEMPGEGMANGTTATMRTGITEELPMPTNSTEEIPVEMPETMPTITEDLPAAILEEGVINWTLVATMIKLEGTVGGGTPGDLGGVMPEDEMPGDVVSHKCCEVSYDFKLC